MFECVNVVDDGDFVGQLFDCMNGSLFKIIIKGICVGQIVLVIDFRCVIVWFIIYGDYVRCFLVFFVEFIGN